MTVAALALLFALLPQDRDDRVLALVRRLREDDIVARAEATKALIALGPAATATLQSEREAGDTDFRARVDAVLHEIGRIERVRPLWPAEQRVTVDLGDAPLRQALRESLGPFGLRAIFPGAQGDGLTEEAAGRRVTVRLKDATFWQALDALTTAGEWKLARDRDLRNVLRPRTWGSGMSVVDVDPGRLYADTIVLKGRPAIRVGLALPPRFVRLGAAAPTFSIQSEGKTVRFEDMSDGRTTWSGARRDSGVFLTDVREVVLDGVAPGDEVTIAGEVTFRSVADFERHEIALPVEKLQTTIKLTGQGERMPLTGWLEDKSGTWLEDMPLERLPRSKKVTVLRINSEWIGFTHDAGQQESAWCVGTRAARLVLIEITRQAEHRRPFKLRLRLAKP